MLLNGGEFLLDLTALSLVASASSVTISNENVLSQLTDLKSYIKNQKAIKPVWIKFFDDDSDEIVVARGEIRKLLDDLEFDIFISSKGKTLTIHIEFTQKLDDNSNPIDDYYIDSGDASLVYNVVSSGTKLYKHLITDGDYYIIVITPRENAFTNAISLVEFIDEIIESNFVCIYDGESVGCYIYFISNTAFTFTSIDTNGFMVGTTINDFDYTNVTDTVTEL